MASTDFLKNGRITRCFWVYSYMGEVTSMIISVGGEAQYNLPDPVAVYSRLCNFAVSLEQTKTDAGFISGPVFIFDGFPGAIH